MEAIARRTPDVLLRIGGFGIVKEPLLSLCRAGVLSYHHGDMRRYRGQPPAFWELYHGERSIGRIRRDAVEHVTRRTLEDG